MGNGEHDDGDAAGRRKRSEGEDKKQRGPAKRLTMLYVVAAQDKSAEFLPESQISLVRERLDELSQLR